MEDNIEHPLHCFSGVWLFRPFAGLPSGSFAPGSFAPWLIRPLCLADTPPGFFAPHLGRFAPVEYR